MSGRKAAFKSNLTYNYPACFIKRRTLANTFAYLGDILNSCMPLSVSWMLPQEDNRLFLQRFSTFY